MATKLNTLEDLLVDQLKDLYNAEHQLIKALPRMAKTANSPDLKKGFEDHLEQTKTQAERIEQIFSQGNLDGSPAGKKCVAMEGLIGEGQEMIRENMDPNVKDAALIAAAQKVEHYEIASYGTVRTFAQELGLKRVADMLQQTLNEEEQTNDKLTSLAESHINRSAR